MLIRLLNLLTMPLDTKRIVAQASADMLRLMPKNYPSAADLKNFAPLDFAVRNDGVRTTGSVTSADILPGTFSPALWAYFMPLAALSLLGLLSNVAALVFGAFVPFSEFGSVMAAMEGGLLARFLGALWITIKGMWLANLIAWIPVLLAFYFAYVWLAEGDPSKDTFYSIWGPFFAVSAIAVLVPVLGPLFFVVFCMFLLWFPILFSKATEKARQSSITEALKDDRMVSVSRDRAKLELIRELQGARSLLDKSALFPVGVSMGVLRRDGDPLTPDPEDILWGSFGDLESEGTLSRHLFVAGSTGSGKSVFLKQLVKEWRTSCAGGALVLDGLGKLPGECEEDLDLVVTPETVRLNLLQGLPPINAASVLKSFSGMVDESDPRAVWTKATSDCALNALIVLEHLISYKTRAPALSLDGEAQQAFDETEYSLFALDRFVNDNAWRTKLLTIASEHLGTDFRSRKYLRKAYTYWGSEWPSMGNETRGSVQFSLSTVLTQLLANPLLENWIGQDADIDLIDAIAKGRCIGFSAPEADYGQGGVLASLFVSAALYTRMRSRSRNSKWKETEQPVMLVVDEAAEFAINKQTARIASQARNFHLKLVLATQTYEQVIECCGSEHSAKAMLNHFRSRITFESSRLTYEWTAEHAGSRDRFVTSEQDVEAGNLSNLVSAEAASGIVGMASGRLLDQIGSITSWLTRLRRLFSIHDQRFEQERDEIRRKATLKGRIKKLPALTADEMALELQGFVAFAIIMRGGYRRREVLNMMPAHIEKLLRDAVNRYRVEQDAARASLPNSRRSLPALEAR